jgi:hypothetical protein
MYRPNILINTLEHKSAALIVPSQSPDDDDGGGDGHEAYEHH